MKTFRKYLSGLLALSSSVVALAATEPEVRSFSLHFESSQYADSIITSNPALHFERIIPISSNPVIEARHQREGLNLLYRVDLKDSKQMATVLPRFQNSRGIKKAAPTRMVKLNNPKPNPEYTAQENLQLMTQSNVNEAIFPNDPFFYKQWHYDHSSYTNINLSKAWDIEKGNPNVVVAVMDCWIDNQHPDLAPNMWINEAELNGTPGVDDDGNGYIDDIYGYNWIGENSNEAGNHGTHIAGTIAAVNNNGIGGCGIAGGDGLHGGARIMSIGINAPGVATKFVADWEICQAYVYAADNGAVISSNSWGGPEINTPLITTGINYFIRNAGQYEGSPMNGGLVVFAAGNDNKAIPNSPFNDPELLWDNVIMVGSVDQNGIKSNFSNYGDWIDVMAPGGNSNGISIFSTHPGGDYYYSDGTSMACPHVSGVAALVVSKYGDGKLRPHDVKERIRQSVNDVYSSNAGRCFENQLGKGVIDAYKALVDNPHVLPEKVKNLKAVVSYGEVEISFDVPSDGNGVAPEYCNIYFEGMIGPIVAIHIGEYKVGQNISEYFPYYRIPSEGRICIEAEDKWGNKSAKSEWFDLVEDDSTFYIFNTYKTDTFLAYKPSSIDELLRPSELKLRFPYTNGAYSYDCVVNDPNGVVSCEFVSDGSFHYIEVSILPDEKTPLGTYPFTLTLNDKSDVSASLSKTFYYKVIEGIKTPAGPVLSPDFSTEIFASDNSGSIEIDLNPLFTDPFGYSVTIPDAVIESYDFINSFYGKVENGVLSGDYEFGDSFNIDPSQEKIIFTIKSHNEHLIETKTDFIIHAPGYSGISEVHKDIETGKKGIFTIMGVRLNTNVENLPSGIYIIDGKKVRIK